VHIGRGDNELVAVLSGAHDPLQRMFVAPEKRPVRLPSRLIGIEHSLLDVMGPDLVAARLSLSDEPLCED